MGGTLSRQGARTVERLHGVKQMFKTKTGRLRYMDNLLTLPRQCLLVTMVSMFVL